MRSYPTRLVKCVNVLVTKNEYIVKQLEKLIIECSQNACKFHVFIFFNEKNVPRGFRFLSGSPKQPAYRWTTRAFFRVLIVE